MTTFGEAMNEARDRKGILARHPFRAGAHFEGQGWAVVGAGFQSVAYVNTSDGADLVAELLNAKHAELFSEQPHASQQPADAASVSDEDVKAGVRAYNGKLCECRNNPNHNDVLHYCVRAVLENFASRRPTAGRVAPVVNIVDERRRTGKLDTWQTVDDHPGFIGRVHNHGPEDGPGLDCIERRVDGRLLGACLLPMTEDARLLNGISAALLECEGHNRPCECGWARAIDILRAAPDAGGAK